jgi:hypothetical protein
MSKRLRQLSTQRLAQFDAIVGPIDAIEGWFGTQHERDLPRIVYHKKHKSY